MRVQHLAEGVVTNLGEASVLLVTSQRADVQNCVLADTFVKVEHTNESMGISFFRRYHERLKIYIILKHW